ncbi:hypothetical protein EV361DRAFT_949079 [Lentinula raphanica]|uniref:Uncharacterized protein n=1 Tax=Lentinula raphanica TaxID=153919 RepID=A0AA38PC75_9AGAR|nr:hypothetical protein F5878DRAFT_613760 [Lentinula raphanica]KAJ3972149.1 hypothetical protein EV361DRAFT_949079 [Lentinula raphanica]
MSTIRRNKPVLQVFRWPSTSAVPNYQALHALTTGTLPQYTNNTSGSTPVHSSRHTLISLLQSIQKVAACLTNDPALTRAKVFRFSAPIAVFLSLLATIALFPQEWYNESSVDSLKQKTIKGVFFLMITLLAVFGTLSLLWILIWLLAASVKRFVEVDLATRQRSPGVFDDLLGGFFTN